jgi:hypothetical protein
VSQLLEAVDWPGVWRGLRQDVTMGAADEWDEGNVVQRGFRALTCPVLLPCYLALRLTVPMVDAASYSQQWLVASLLCCPLGAVIYFRAFQMWVVQAGWRGACICPAAWQPSRAQHALKAGLLRPS